MCVSNLLNVVFVASWIPSPLSRWARRNTNKYAKCLLICCEHDLFHSDIFITNWDHIWRMKRSATWKQDMKRSVNLAQSSFARHTSNIQIIPDSWFHITHEECLLSAYCCSRFRPSWCYTTVCCCHCQNKATTRLINQILSRSLVRVLNIVL